MRPANYYTHPGFERAGLKRRDSDWIRAALTDAAAQFVPVWRTHNLIVELAGAEPRAIVLASEHATLITVICFRNAFVITSVLCCCSISKKSTPLSAVLKHSNLEPPATASYGD